MQVDTELDATLTPLVEALETIISVQRHLHPIMIEQLKEKMRVRREPLERTRERLKSLKWLV